MKNKPVIVEGDRKAVHPRGERDNKFTLLRAVGWFGIVIATPFFLWVPLGLIGLAPSIVDIFGVVGLRVPAAITIGGLLLAAIGFHRI